MDTVRFPSSIYSIVYHISKVSILPVNTTLLSKSYSLNLFGNLGFKVFEDTYPLGTIHLT